MPYSPRSTSQPARSARTGGQMGPRSPLHWQSQTVLLLVLPAAAVWAAVLLLRLLAAGPAPAYIVAVAVSLAAAVALALLVWLARAGTAAGAGTGGLLLLCFCFTTPGRHSSAWALLAMLALTLGATRLSRGGKPEDTSGVPEEERRHGRNAAQVAANLGVAALAGLLINVHGRAVALTVLLAALAEAAGDTVASELGQSLAGTPRLITTWQPVAPGTDGGITLEGTALGALAAALVAAVGAATLPLPWRTAGLAATAGLAGVLFDSLLGATLERKGWLNNDAVNFLSTLFSAAVALGAAQTWS